MALVKYISIVATPDQQPYLAFCSGRAKVKLGGFVGGHYCTLLTTNLYPKEEKRAHISTYAHTTNQIPLVPLESIFCRYNDKNKWNYTTSRKCKPEILFRNALHQNE